MWENQKDDIENLIDITGSNYAAVMYSAKLARKYLHKAKNSIPESIALSWAITGKEPINLEERIRLRLKSLDPMSDTFIQDIVYCIDDKRVRDAVENSYRLSINSKRLRFDYKNIDNVNIQARIRIITRMIYFRKTGVNVTYE